MMLESSLGKILAAKPVEPSLSTEDATANPVKSEAEVRIVFRFFVEEQIVFNGKIEKVKQLESEELSRIVSRIAWDGAKDEKKPLLDKEPTKNDKILDCNHQDAGENEPCETTCTTKSTDGASMPDNANSTSQDCGSSDVTSMDCSLLVTNDMTMKETPPLGIDEAPMNQGLVLCDPPATTESDNYTSASIPRQVCRADLQLDSSYQVHAFNDIQQQLDPRKDAKQESVIDETPSFLQECELAAADAATAAAENQMIVEALYDCVYNVDLESRKSDQKLISHTERLVDEDAQGTTKDGYNKTQRVEHNEEQSSDTSKETAKLDKKPLMEAANVPSNNEITQVTISSSDDSFFKEKEAHQTCMDDLSSRLENTKKTDANLSARRRNTSDTVTSNRRVRRGGGKDQRTSRISCSDTLVENAHERQVLDSSEASNQSGENFTRQSKVFAKWSDNHFYPGTILKPSKERKFEIGFFDGARKDVVETDLIPLDNIIQRQVRVSIAKDYCVNAIVHEKLTTNNGQPMFGVEYQQNGLVKKCVPLRDIFLTAEQGIPLINQPMRPDKNPDESMFAGVDLDNIVHVKRSRRLQEMDDLDTTDETTPTQPPINSNGGRRKRGQYNMRSTTNRARASNNKSDASSEKGSKRFHSDVNNQDTPASSCSPDDLKSHLHSSNINPPSESSSSTGSTNGASNVHEMGQEFYFESSSPHRTKTSLLL